MLKNGNINKNRVAKRIAKVSWAVEHSTDADLVLLACLVDIEVTQRNLQGEVERNFNVILKQMK